MTGFILYITMFPELTIKNLIRDGEVENVHHQTRSGRLHSGHKFKVVIPREVPPADGGHSLQGIILRSVKVISPAAITHDQKEWLFSRRRVIIQGEFIVMGS